MFLQKGLGSHDRETGVNTPEPGGDHPCAKGVHPEPVVLGSRPRQTGALMAVAKGVDLELQTAKTLIEPRLEVPGLPVRVLDHRNNKFSYQPGQSSRERTASSICYLFCCTPNAPR